MGDKKPRWRRSDSDAEQFKWWLLESVERIDALTRAATIRITDADREKFTSSLSTCDVQQLRYLGEKLEEIIDCLRIWHDQIGDALDHRGPYDVKGVARRSSRIRAKHASPMNIEWLDPWYPVEAAEREELESELHREIVSGHDLYGVPFVGIGRRKDRDEVLLRLQDGTDRLAVVHLNWQVGRAETPPWPSTKFYDDLGAWIRWGMTPDHDAWGSEHWLEELDD